MANLGTFSLSLNVNDIHASRQFYEAFGFEQLDGDVEQGWLILGAGEAKIGLFQGMFDTNIITFNPPDVRAIQRELEERGVTVELKGEMDGEADPARGEAAGESGPAHFTLADPDGNVLLFDQF